MNFYKLSRLLKEAGYDSQVVPGGQTVANQPMQQPVAKQPAQPVQNQQTTQQVNQQTNQQANQQINQRANQQPSQPADAKDVNNLLHKVSSKLGNNINKYNHLVTFLKSRPEMLDLFAQSLDDVGNMQKSNFQRIA